MKRLFLLALVLVLSVSLSVPVFATTAYVVIVEKPHVGSNTSEISVNSANDEVGVFARYNIDWDISAETDTHGVSQLSMTEGNTVVYSMDWSPEAGLVRVGLYDRKSGKYYWAKTSSSPSISGKITVPYTSIWSFAVGNLSDQKINAVGYFIY